MDGADFSGDFHKINVICWKEGIEIFNETLTDDDKKRIVLNSGILPVIHGVEDIFRTSFQADWEYKKSRGSSTLLFHRLSKAIYKYANVVDVFIQQQPDITAVVWGSIRFLVQVAVEEEETGEQIGSALVDIVAEIGRWEQYLESFPYSSRVQHCVARLYAEILSFLVRARAYYKKPRKVRYAKACLTPCKAKFATTIDAIKKHSERLDKEFILEIQKFAANSINVSRKRHLHLSAAISGTFELTADIQRTMHLQNDSVKTRIEASQQESDVHRLRKWLDPKPHPSNNISSPTEGTCGWVLKHNAYHSWVLNNFNRILWISGDLGCGKSVLAKFLSHHSTTGRTITYHFQASVDLESARPIPFLTSILATVLQYVSFVRSPRFDRVLQSLCSLCDQFGSDSRKVPFKSLWAMLEDLIQITPAFTLIVDGLDECEASKELDALLVNLEQLGTAFGTRIIILSRPDCILQPFMNRAMLISMNADIVNPDIALFLDTEISQDRHLPRIRQRILDRVLSNCHGMFLWAVLLLKHVQDADTPKMQADRLVAFPEGLDAAYEEILAVSTARLSHGKLQRRREIFLILLGARRPLTVDEVCIALALRPFSTQLNEEELPFEAEEHLLNICRPLATVSRGYLQFSHLSFKEFLLRFPATNDPAPRDVQVHMTYEDSNSYLARKCFSRLSEAQYKSPNRIASFLRRNVYPDTASTSDEDQAIQETVLYDYAASNWQIHLTALESPKPEILKLAQQFLHGNEFVSWAEYIFGKNNDNTPIAKVRSLLLPWHSNLPPDSKVQVEVGDYFANPYRALSNYYAEAGTDKVLQWLCLYRLADYYIIITDSDTAHKVRKEVVAGLTDLLGKNHPLTLRATSKMALHYIIIGDMKRAAKLYLKTSRLQLEVVGEDKPDSFESLHYAAAAQYYMAQYTLSSVNQSKAAGGLLKILGPTSLLFLICQLSYSYAIARLGELDQAHSLLEDIYKSRSELLGSENALALMAQVALGEVQRKLGQLDKAKENLTQAYEARIKVWGISPFSSVDTAIHLIIVCRELGKPEEAWKHMEFVSQPGILEPYFERLCQVAHLKALLSIDAGKSEEATDVLRAILNRSHELGRESNNRSLLWVRLTQSTILREAGKKDEASELFEDIVMSTKEEDSDSAPSLDGEPQSPKVLGLAEKALRLVRDRMESEADALLSDNELMWKRENDFWIPSGGPAADTGWMKGP